MADKDALRLIGDMPLVEGAHLILIFHLCHTPHPLSQSVSQSVSQSASQSVSHDKDALGLIRDMSILEGAHLILFFYLWGLGFRV